MLYELQISTFQSPRLPPIPQKDYSRPLHVDCSVEYELPSQVKPPPSDGKPDPLLMIHPCYFRKLEAQRRSPFINNLPGRGVKFPKEESKPTIPWSPHIWGQRSPLAAERFPDFETTKSTGKYRQYLRTQRLHPYLGSSMWPHGGTSQIKPISCYNV